MERNNHSKCSSRCAKFRQALANSSAGRAIHRISHYHQQEPSGSQVPQPRHIRGNHKGKGHGEVPIKFVDHPNHSNFNGQTQVGNRIEPEHPHYASANRAAAHYASTNRVAAIKGEEKGKSTAQESERQHDKKDMRTIFSVSTFKGLGRN